MHFEIDGPCMLGEADTLTTVDEIRRGDLVWFERTGPRDVALRLAPAPPGVGCYRIDRGDDPGTVRLTALPPGPE